MSSDPDFSKLETAFTTNDGRSINFVTLVTALGGAFVSVLVAAYIELIERATELNVWVLGGIADFFARIVTFTLGQSAAAQVQSFQAALESSQGLGPFLPWLVAIEAIIVTGLFAAAIGVVLR